MSAGDSSNGRLRAVLFDMDGVLLVSGPVLFEAARRMFSDRHGIEITREDVRPFIGAGETNYLRGVAAKHGVALDWPADRDRTMATYYELAPQRLQAVPGVHRFVAACRDRNLRVAVASSAHRDKLERNLDAIGLPSSSFDAVVTGEELKATKPDPEVFLVAARRVAIAPAQCLVVEDALNGIEAAHRAGCPCLAVATSFDRATLAATTASWVVADLEEACGLLDAFAAT